MCVLYKNINSHKPEKKKKNEHWLIKKNLNMKIQKQMLNARTKKFDCILIPVWPQHLIYMTSDLLSA